MIVAYDDCNGTLACEQGLLDVDAGGAVVIVREQQIPVPDDTGTPIMSSGGT